MRKIIVRNYGIHLKYTEGLVGYLDMQIRCYHPSATFYNVNEAVMSEKFEIVADFCV